MEPLESSMRSPSAPRMPSTLDVRWVGGLIESHREPGYEFGGSCEARTLEVITGHCQNFLPIWSKVKVLECGKFLEILCGDTVELKR